MSYRGCTAKTSVTVTSPQASAAPNACECFDGQKIFFSAMGPRSVFITGASRGLGLEFVRQILFQPSLPQFLFASCIDASRADELQALSKKNSSLQILQMDVTKDDEIASAFEQTRAVLLDRGLNLLINNAGIYSREDTLIPISLVRITAPVWEVFCSETWL